MARLFKNDSFNHICPSVWHWLVKRRSVRVRTISVRYLFACNLSCRTACVAVLIALLPLTSGCSFGPTKVEVPPIEPEDLATAAMEEFDKNGDGTLDNGELVACPALLDAAKKEAVDKNRDKRLSREELVERFAGWANGGIGVSYLSCRVTKAGKPLPGALVKLRPIDLFADVIYSAEGTTNGRGTATLAMDSSHLPESLQRIKAVQQGLYRVEITHDSVIIPDKYNTATTLGLEVSFDSGGYVVSFDL
jgi:hypothetical protein